MKYLFAMLCVATLLLLASATGLVIAIIQELMHVPT